MNSLYDKQTKGLIVLLLVAFGLITAGSMLGYSEIEQLREKLNQQEMQNDGEAKGQGIYTPDGGTVGGSELTPVLGQQQQWPDVGNMEGHCLLVVVKPPRNEPDELTEENTIRVPMQLCLSFLKTMVELRDIGFLSSDSLIFKKGT